MKVPNYSCERTLLVDNEQWTKPAPPILAPRQGCEEGRFPRGKPLESLEAAGQSRRGVAMWRSIGGNEEMDFITKLKYKNTKMDEGGRERGREKEELNSEGKKPLAAKPTVA